MYSFSIIVLYWFTMSSSLQIHNMNQSFSSCFVFGDVHSGKGLLQKPTSGLTKVQFGPSLFYKSSNVWSSRNHGVGGVKTYGTLNIESFAEKMKKGL